VEVVPGRCVCDAQGEGEQQGEWKPPPPEVLATRRILKAKRPGRGAAKAADGATAPSPFSGISLTAPAPAANPFAAVSLTAPAAPAVATAAPTAGSPDVPAAAADAAEPSAAEAAEPSAAEAAKPSAAEPSLAKAAAASPAAPAASNSSPAPSATAAAAATAASFAVPSTSTLGLFGQKHEEVAASNTASLSALASTTTPAPFAGAGSMWTGGGFGSLSGKGGFGTSGAGFGATAAAASTSSAADAASTVVRTLHSFGSLRDTLDMSLRHTTLEYALQLRAASLATDVGRREWLVAAGGARLCVLVWNAGGNGHQRVPFAAECLRCQQGSVAVQGQRGRRCQCRRRREPRRARDQAAGAGVFTPLCVDGRSSMSRFLETCMPLGRWPWDGVLILLHDGAAGGADGGYADPHGRGG
jgi:hypothetical protein